DEASIDDIIWTGKLETLKEKAHKSGIQKTVHKKEIFDYVEKAIKKNRIIHYLPPYQAYNKILLSQLLQTPISELHPSVPFTKAVVSQRSVKEKQEIEEIEKALAVSVEMHKLAMLATKPGMKDRKSEEHTSELQS